MLNAHLCIIGVPPVGLTSLDVKPSKGGACHGGHSEDGLEKHDVEVCVWYSGEET